MFLIETARLTICKTSEIAFCGTEIYSIMLKSSNHKIGELTLMESGEVCYEVEIPYRGKGFAREALKAFVEKTNEEGEKIFLRISKTNTRSQIVAASAGFRRVASSEQTRIERWEINQE